MAISLSSRTVCVAALFLTFLAPAGWAHVGEHPSIHDTLASVMARFRETIPPDELMRLDTDEAVELLTLDEKHVLGTEFLRFTVDVPVTVYVVRDARQGEQPFWLAERGFEQSAATLQVDGHPYELWNKAFDAGSIGLGVSGFREHKRPYFVVVAPQRPGTELSITDVYPGRHREGTLEDGERPYVDEGWELSDVPLLMRGATTLRGVADRGEETRLVRVYRQTAYPATEQPDQITLTWSANPKTTQTVQWRTAPSVEAGQVRWRSAASDAEWRTIGALREELEDPYLVNDPVNARFTAIMTGLAPGASYTYQVGHGETWSEPATFTTAPEGATPFKFIYMGDAQNGLDTWGTLMDKAFAQEPDAMFYIMAGDLVNRGNERDDWDSFFANSAGIYDRRQLVPAIGNHEDQGPNGPWMYLALFDLPKAGPPEIEKERAYAFEYSNALFVILDSNLPPNQQAEWLEARLAESNATWKFVVYHHPAYSSKPERDNALLRRFWSNLFDKYHVDMALQGHDHAYLRTYPMYNEERVDSAAEGTYYVVSVSGTKMYDQDPREYSEVAFTNVATFQVLDITIDGDRLEYRAYDAAGDVRDELVIEK